jgi:hypothetical protein
VVEEVVLSSRKCRSRQLPPAIFDAECGNISRFYASGKVYEVSIISKRFSYAIRVNINISAND